MSKPLMSWFFFLCLSTMMVSYVDATPPFPGKENEADIHRSLQRLPDTTSGKDEEPSEKITSKATADEAPIAMLTNEMLVHVFSFLSMNNHDLVSFVNRHWHGIANIKEGSGPFSDYLKVKETYEEVSRNFNYAPTLPVAFNGLQSLWQVQESFKMKNRPENEVRRLARACSKGIFPLKSKILDIKDHCLIGVNYNIPWARGALVRTFNLSGQESFVRMLNRKLGNYFNKHVNLSWSERDRSLKKLETFDSWCLLDLSLCEMFPLVVYGNISQFEKATYFMKELLRDGNYAAVKGQGYRYYQKQKYAEAGRYFDFAIESDLAAKNTGESFLNPYDYKMAADCFFAQRKYSKAAEFYEIALGKAAENKLGYKPYQQTAYSFLQLYDYERAIKYYEIAIKEDPNDVSSASYHNAGYIMAQLGQPSKALEYYKKAMEKDPNCSAIVYLHTSQTYLKLEDSLKADEYFKKALEKDPNVCIKSKENEKA